MSDWKPTEVGQRFRARFNPVAFATLRPEARNFAGITAEFVASWLITPDDGGPYVGQWACHVVGRQWCAVFPWWVPWEDLAEIEPLQNADMPRGVWCAHRGSMPDGSRPAFTPEEEQRIEELLHKAKLLRADEKSTLRCASPVFYFDERLSDGDTKLFERYMFRTYVAKNL